jgi:hypothetical protein
VGESWWMLWRWLYESDSGAEGTVGEEEDGLKWAAREERRLRADDMLGGRSACSWPWELQCCLEERKVQLEKKSKLCNGAAVQKRFTFGTRYVLKEQAKGLKTAAA